MSGVYEQNNIAYRIEEMRKKVAFKKKIAKCMEAAWVGLIIAVILLNMISVYFLLITENVMNVINYVCIAIIVLLTMFMTGAHIKYSVDLKKYNNIFKNQFVVKVLNEIFENVVFCEGVKDIRTLDQYKKQLTSMGIIQTGNIFIAEDFLSADYRGVHFERADVYTANSSNNSTTDYFEGRIYQLTFIKQITSVMQIRAKAFEHPVLPRNVDREKDCIKMENVEFNDRFEVYAHAQQEAFYVLTPRMMEVILRLEKKFKSICINIQGNKMVLAINSSLNSLEPQLEQEVEYETERRRILGELQEIVDIIDGLELDNTYFQGNY